ncbi:chemotaxis protein CheW [candidate division KSB3 bacterium]|uniref:Chemotaxis protein CheW n=1 Tax=candidate division KSB3 bacterium TaxID=2044937 RepID=A0A9D5JVN0_9BACT|nr:chemotaxis protein CheW [candidate division KSB3 bacterium]MBD3324978.1 chemotaxis protein CheW [candidate division KSB3 bacterium]
MRSNQTTPGDAGEIQLVSFLLGGEEFGADILIVQEIIRMTPITRVPNAPHFVEGVINLRGKVIPVIDLRKRLNVSERPEDTRKVRIIVADIGGKITGFIVDAVSQVLRIPTNSIEPPPSIVVAGIESEYITGVSKLDDRLLILLDFTKILTKDEQRKLTEVKA